MLYTTLFLASLGLQVSASDVFKRQRPNCNADNCARAVTGTVGTRPVFGKLADCSSFFRATVTPATVTSTLTVRASTTVTTTVSSVVDTSSGGAGGSTGGSTGSSSAGAGTGTSTGAGTGTSTGAGTGTSTGAGTGTSTRTGSGTSTGAAGTGTSTGAGTATTTTAAVVKRAGQRLELALAPPENLAARQVTAIPASIPAYAAACSGAYRYSSACSCFGVTATTTTLAAPVRTVTVTATSTSVVTVSRPVCANHPYVFTGGYLNSPVGGSYNFNNNFFNVTEPTVCCGHCFTTPGCLYNEIATVDNADGTTTDGCRLIIASGATAATGVSAQCPLGVYEVVLSSGDYYGIGPCERVVGMA